MFFFLAMIVKSVGWKKDESFENPCRDNATLSEESITDPRDALRRIRTKRRRAVSVCRGNFFPTVSASVRRPPAVGRTTFFGLFSGSPLTNTPTSGKIHLLYGSPDGEIGRRTSFRCWRLHGRGGSSPLPGTKLS